MIAPNRVVERGIREKAREAMTSLDRLVAVANAKEIKDEEWEREVQGHELMLCYLETRVATQAMPVFRTATSLEIWLSFTRRCTTVSSTPMMLHHYETFGD